MAESRLTSGTPNKLNIPSLREQVYSYLRNSLKNGVLKPDSKFYISLALTEDDLAQTIDAIALAAREMAAQL